MPNSPEASYGDSAERMREFSTHPMAAGNRDDWRTLFVDYAACYGVAVDDATVDRVWGWPLVRWLTEASNGRARSLYDRKAGRPGDLVVYDWPSD